MNLLNQEPTGLKVGKARKDPKYLKAVRGLPCVCCGRSGPCEAHHCRDLPDFNEQGLYKQLPAAARKSHDRDAIPLCAECHWLFHNRRSEFHAICGKDYGHIGPTRAQLSHAELDF